MNIHFNVSSPAAAIKIEANGVSIVCSYGAVGVVSVCALLPLSLYCGADASGAHSIRPDTVMVESASALIFPAAGCSLGVRARIKAT
jgi:hypothetical protein